MRVKVLGTEYEVVIALETDNNPKLKNANGYIEPYSKKLVIENFTPDDMTVENPDAFRRKVLRHEIVHAFLHESGLWESSWADNEEIVDWIAYQGPKVFKAWQEVDAL